MTAVAAWSSPVIYGTREVPRVPREAGKEKQSKENEQRWVCNEDEGKGHRQEAYDHRQVRVIGQFFWTCNGGEGKVQSCGWIQQW